MRNFKNIQAWILASDLAVQIYTRTSNFSKEERYGLISQMRRAAISTLANIAEGASRQHKKDYLNFLYIARGSLSETEALLEISRRLLFLNSSLFEELTLICQKTARCLFGLIRAVESEVYSPWSVVHSLSNSLSTKGGNHVEQII
ncbi:MAG: four helix bundle protein [Deltaproteobacteria bacterium]|nr:four helix bundle protein [Deltaproteobacteria bacterium]